MRFFQHLLIHTRDIFYLLLDASDLSTARRRQPRHTLSSMRVAATLTPAARAMRRFRYAMRIAYALRLRFFARGRAYVTRMLLRLPRVYIAATITPLPLTAA